MLELFADSINNIKSFNALIKALKENYFVFFISLLLLILEVTTFSIEAAPLMWLYIVRWCIKHTQQTIKRTLIESILYEESQKRYLSELDKYYFEKKKWAKEQSVDLESTFFTQCPQNTLLGIRSLVEFLEETGIEVFFYPKEESSAYCNSNSDYAFISINLIEDYGTSKYWDRQLFTLCHEAGYYLNGVEGKDKANEVLAWDTGFDLYKLATNSLPPQDWWLLRKECLASYNIFVD